MTEELHDAYQRLRDHKAFNGSHLSLDRDVQGEEYVQVEPDWVDGPGLAFVVDLARDLELALALTNDGLRLEPHTSDTVQGVESVKRALEGERS